MDGSGSSSINTATSEPLPLQPEQKALELPTMPRQLDTQFDSFDSQMDLIATAVTGMAHVMINDKPIDELGELLSTAGLFQMLNDFCSIGCRLSEPSSDMSVDYQIYATAIIMGWQSVEQYVASSPNWRWLRFLDQEILRDKSTVDRLSAVLVRMIAKYYSLSKMNPPLAEVEIPPWLSPRPSQEAMEHAVIVNYVPWPGMRERLCFGYEKYKTDEFWSRLLAHYRFIWPFDIADIHEVDMQTGLLQFTPIFLQKLYDINSWTLESKFFEWYPEFGPDVMKFEPQLAAVNLTLQTERELTRLRASVDDSEHRPKRLMGSGAAREPALGGYLQSLALLQKSNLRMKNKRAAMRSPPAPSTSGTQP